MLHPAGVIVAQYPTPTALIYDFDGSFTRPLPQLSVESTQAQGVHAATLQTLYQPFVHLTAVDHLEDFQRTAVGATAGVAADGRDKLRRVAQFGGNLLGRLRLQPPLTVNPRCD